MQTFLVGVKSNLLISGTSALQMINDEITVEAETYQIHSNGELTFGDANKKPVLTIAANEFKYVIPKDNIHLISFSKKENAALSYIEKNTTKVNE